MKHDWQNLETYEAVAQKYLSERTGLSVHLDIQENNWNLPHSRSLTLAFRSRKKVQIFFDQGMGYWSLQVSGSFRFNFEQTVEEQVISLETARKSAIVKNSDYQTLISMKLSEN